MRVASALEPFLRRNEPQEQNLTEETWAPDPVEVGKTLDPGTVLQEAKKLMLTGQHEEALQRYLWFFHHALEYNPDLSAVRLSSALADWVELGRRYPKAKQALVAIRKHDADEFAQGRGYFDLFSEVAALNHYLQDDQATEPLFRQFQHSDAALAAQCFPLVEASFVKNHEYAQCLEFIPDPDAAFAGIVETWQRMKHTEDLMAAQPVESPKAAENDIFAQARQKLKQAQDLLAAQQAALQEGLMPTNEPGPFNQSGVVPATAKRIEPPKMADKNFVAQTRQLIEILVGVDQKPEAEKIRDQAVALLPDDRLKSAVTDAEKTIAQNN
jgi:hypothetical protein